MNTLYILGGPPRSGKTTIMKGLIAATNVQFIAADAIEHGMRNVLTGKPHQMLKDIKLSGSAEIKDSFTSGGKRKPFSAIGSEDEFTLNSVLGMLDYYHRNNESVAFEGSAFTPSWVANLKLKDFNIKAAFVGYTNPLHADSILAHAKNTKHDWINDWLEKDRGDEKNIRQWVEKRAALCVELQSEAKKYGFPFFDISTMQFQNYINSVRQYFLES